MTEAFLAQAMERYGDAVYRLALCRLQNVADAEDVYQDTFLRMFQQKADKWEEEHLKAWLLRTAINRCNDIGRRRKTRTVVALEDIPELTARDCAGWIELWDAVCRLPEKQRTVFHLYYAEGYKGKEIAEILNIPQTTVRVSLSRAREQLRKELADHADIS